MAAIAPVKAAADGFRLGQKPVLQLLYWVSPVLPPQWEGFGQLQLHRLPDSGQPPEQDTGPLIEVIDLLLVPHPDGPLQPPGEQGEPPVSIGYAPAAQDGAEKAQVGPVAVAFLIQLLGQGDGGLQIAPVQSVFQRGGPNILKRVFTGGEAVSLQRLNIPLGLLQPAETDILLRGPRMLTGIAVAKVVIRRRLQGKLRIFQRPLRVGVLPAAHHLPKIGAPANAIASGELVVLLQKRFILSHGDLGQVLHHIHTQLGNHKIGVDHHRVFLDLRGRRLKDGAELRRRADALGRIVLKIHLSGIAEPKAQPPIGVLGLIRQPDGLLICVDPWLSFWELFHEPAQLFAVKRFPFHPFSPHTIHTEKPYRFAKATARSCPKQ